MSNLTTRSYEKTQKNKVRKPILYTHVHVSTCILISRSIERDIEICRDIYLEMYIYVYIDIYSVYNT